MIIEKLLELGNSRSVIYLNALAAKYNGEKLPPKVFNKAERRHVDLIAKAIINAEKQINEGKEEVTLNLTKNEKMLLSSWINSMNDTDNIRYNASDDIIYFTTKEGKRTYKRITEQDREMIISLYNEDKSASYSQIAQLIGISPTTVGKIIKQYKSDNLYDDSKEQKEEPLLILLNNYVKVGLVADRHNMPVNDFIYDNIDSNLMFDYNNLEQIAANFIKEHVVNNDTLIVYCSGLQCALSSVIKVCYENNVQLILMHYNSDTGKYQEQNISCKNTLPNCINSLVNNNNIAYTYKCYIDEIINNRYGVKINQIIYDDNGTIVDNKGIICTDINCALEWYDKYGYESSIAYVKQFKINDDGRYEFYGYEMRLSHLINN